MSNMGSSSSLTDADADADAVADADSLLLFMPCGCSLSENASRVGDCETTLGEGCDEKWEEKEVVEDKDPVETCRRCCAACWSHCSGEVWIRGKVEAARPTLERCGCCERSVVVVAEWRFSEGWGGRDDSDGEGDSPDVAGRCGEVEGMCCRGEGGEEGDEEEGGEASASVAMDTEPRDGGETESGGESGEGSEEWAGMTDL